MLSLFHAQQDSCFIRFGPEVSSKGNTCSFVLLFFEMDFSKMDFIRAPFFPKMDFQEFQETKLENPAGVLMHHF